MSQADSSVALHRDLRHSWVVVSYSEHVVDIPPCAGEKPVGRKQPVRHSIMLSHILISPVHSLFAAHRVFTRAGKDVTSNTSVKRVTYFSL
jgi:hypothetical protein